MKSENCKPAASTDINSVLRLTLTNMLIPVWLEVCMTVKNQGPTSGMQLRSTNGNSVCQQGNQSRKYDTLAEKYAYASNVVRLGH